MTESAAQVLAERLGMVLLQCGQSLATAESCTGGGIAHLITSIPGSSQWFERGFVTYSNAAKQELLGVSSESLEQYGAVSEQVATAMALGTLQNSRAAITVAVTGIAGPDGDSPGKPVGTVWFAWATRQGHVHAAEAHFQGNRQQVREQSVLLAVQGVLDLVESST